MKAAVFHGSGQPLSIETVPDPVPEPGEMILKVTACGICGSDLHATLEHTAWGIPAGTVMGHEFAGEIAEITKEVDGEWQVGERVCALPTISCGKCPGCLTGTSACTNPHGSTGLGDIPGAYAEFVRIGPMQSIRLPEGVSDDDGATVEPLSVGLHAVHKAALRPGDNVLILGAGPVGLSTTLWAKFFGARNVIVSELSAGRGALAASFGATDLIDASKEDDVVAAYTARTGVAPDVIFEAVGVPGMLQQCIGMAPRDTRIVVVGVCMEPDQILPLGAILKELQFNFVLGYRKEDFQFTVDMLDQGRIASAPMVTDHISLDELPDAFEALRKPTTQCKVMVRPWNGRA